jgi:hypothetical protein
MSGVFAWGLFSRGIFAVDVVSEESKFVVVLAVVVGGRWVVVVSVRHCAFLFFAFALWCP